MSYRWHKSSAQREAGGAAGLASDKRTVVSNAAKRRQRLNLSLQIKQNARHLLAGLNSLHARLEAAFSRNQVDGVLRVGCFSTAFGDAFTRVASFLGGAV